MVGLKSATWYSIKPSPTARLYTSTSTCKVMCQVGQAFRPNNSDEFISFQSFRRNNSADLVSSDQATLTPRLKLVSNPCVGCDAPPCSLCSGNPLEVRGKGQGARGMLAFTRKITDTTQVDHLLAWHKRCHRNNRQQWDRLRAVIIEELSPCFFSCFEKITGKPGKSGNIS